MKYQSTDPNKLGLVSLGITFGAILFLGLVALGIYAII